MNYFDTICSNIYKYSQEKNIDVIKEKLSKEFLITGYYLASDWSKYGAKPFVYSKEAQEFYENTDSFMYSLHIWHFTPHRIKLKIDLVNFIKKIENITQKTRLKILMLGDGLGYDSIFIKKECNNIDLSYFEFDGSNSFCFAKNIFEDKDIDVNMIGKLEDIKLNYYDIVVNLDVLEHIPNPSNIIKNIHSYLVDDGFAAITTAFDSLNILNPTHLLENLKYSGKTISLFENNGFSLYNISDSDIYLFSKKKLTDSIKLNFTVKIKNFIKFFYYKFKYRKLINLTQIDLKNTVKNIDFLILKNHY